MLYISTFSGRAVFAQDWQAASCVPNITANTYGERGAAGEKTAIWAVKDVRFACRKKVCLIVDMQRCLPTLKPTERSLHGPVICLRSPTYNSTQNHCLERGIYFVFPGWRHSGCTLSNISFRVHKVELVQPQEEIWLYCFSFIRAIMLRPSSHGNNTREKPKWLSVPLSLPY